MQVGVATVSEKSAAYAREIHEGLKSAGLRVELDLSSEKIGPKKQRMRDAKINYILVVGEKEAAERTVNVNDRDGRTIGNKPLGAVVEALRSEIASKGRGELGFPPPGTTERVRCHS
ncbi:MAG: hypothetical protein IID05_12320 [Gemmatimonadetes bacterium]|nr:hypothetical protein [Gemmatimonadota bacterium]